jgi:hypothetical protein
MTRTESIMPNTRPRSTLPRSPLVRGEENRAPSPDKGRAGEGFAAMEQEPVSGANRAAINPPRSPLVRGEENPRPAFCFLSPVSCPLTSGAIR